MDLKLSLNLEEVNFILTCLGNMPYNKSASLIEKIRVQVIQQLPVQEQPSEVKDNEDPPANQE